MGTGSSSSGSRWPGHEDLCRLDEWMELYLQLHYINMSSWRAKGKLNCTLRNAFFHKRQDILR